MNTYKLRYRLKGIPYPLFKEVQARCIADAKTLLQAMVTNATGIQVDATRYNT